MYTKESIFNLYLLFMKKAIYYLSILFLVVCLTQSASAQFEGKITYNSYEYSGDVEEKQDEFNLFITPERILLQGNNQYEVMGSIETEGILVRLDFQDFVFLTGKEKALKISKSDITSIMNMFGDKESTSKAVEKSNDINYERTGEIKKIKGYQTEKFIFRDEDKKNGYTAVWMTKDIDVNWGMLAESWSGGASKIINNFPTDIVFKEKYFPISVEDYEGDKLVSKLEASAINESPVARGMVKIPTNVQVLSFQDYLFQKMSEQ